MLRAATVVSTIRKDVGWESLEHIFALTIIPNLCMGSLGSNAALDIGGPVEIGVLEQ